MSKGTDIRLMAGSGVRIPFLNYNTSGRLVMSANQGVQIPPIKGPDTRIVDTGYSTQLNKFTYDVRVENDTLFFRTIKRFNNRSDEWTNDAWSSLIVIGYDVVANELIHYEVPKYRILGSKFGMSYEVNEQYINGLSEGSIIPAGTKLAWNRANKGNGYKNGKNLNTAIMSLPEVGEDCILLSDKVLNDYGIKMYDMHEVSYGKSSLLADVHKTLDGDYKALPDVGDILEAGDVLYSSIDLDLRALKKEDYSIINNAILYSKKGMRSRRPHFTNHNILKYNAKIVDVNILYNPKAGESIESDAVNTQAASYLMMLKTYHRGIVDAYNYYKRNYPNGNVNPDTSNLIVDSMVFIEKPIRGREPRVTRKKKRNALDMYNVQITTEYDITPNASWKFSNLYGGKGVIKVVPHEDMPRDDNGVVADIAIFSKGIISRTNLGVLYEQYFTASSRQMKKAIMSLLAVKDSRDIDKLLDTEITTAYNYILDYLSHFNTLQYKLYSGTYVGDNKFNPKGTLHNNKKATKDEMIEILKEIFDHELYLVYNVAEEESVYDIVNRLEASKFKLKYGHIHFRNPINGEMQTMKSRGFIAPIYTVLLNKISDNFLASSTFFLNGYGLPTGKSKEDNRFPYKFKGVRGWGESEMRLVAAYADPRLIQVLADRSRSIENHRQFYRNQLETGSIQNETLIPNRKEDADIAIDIISAILEPAGIKIDVVN